MSTRLGAAEAQLDAFRGAGKWEDVARVYKTLEKTFDSSITSPSHPTAGDVMAYRYVVCGEIAAHKKKYEEARKCYVKALSQAPTYPDALILLAVLHIES